MSLPCPFQAETCKIEVHHLFIMFHLLTVTCYLFQQQSQPEKQEAATGGVANADDQAEEPGDAGKLEVELTQEKLVRLQVR